MPRAWQHMQLERAFSTGESRNAQTSTHAIFVGHCREIPTFQGLWWDIEGQLSLYHHSARVLSVNFTEDRITDYGYYGYSETTSSHLTGWRVLLQQMQIIGVHSLNPRWNPFDWTWDYRRSPKARPRGEGWHVDMKTRFRERVPWVQWVDGVAWFHGPSWDGELHGRYLSVRSELLVNKHSLWWTGGWDARGQWSKQFIDDDAERRWKALQARRRRAQARVLEAS